MNYNYNNELKYVDTLMAIHDLGQLLFVYVCMCECDVLYYGLLYAIVYFIPIL